MNAAASSSSRSSPRRPRPDIARATTSSLVTTLVLAAVAPVANAFAPNLIFNVTLPVSYGSYFNGVSPMSKASAFVAGVTPTNAWYTMYPDAPPQYNGADVAKGTPYWGLNATLVDSSNLTVWDQAYFSTMAFGRSIYVQGSASWDNASVMDALLINTQGEVNYQSVAYQSIEQTQGTTLVNQLNQSWGFRNWKLSVGKDYIGAMDIRVDSVTVESGMQMVVDNATAATWDNVNITDIRASKNGKLNPFFNCTSNWAAQGAWGSGANLIADYGGASINLSANGNDSCTFTLPTNTSYVFFNGTLGPYNNGATVLTVLPAPPGTGQGGKIKWNAPAQYNIPNAAMYYTALDPAVQYTMSLGTDDPAHAGNAGFTGITLYSTKGVNNAPSTPMTAESGIDPTGTNGSVPAQTAAGGAEPASQPPKSSEKSALIGGVLGGALALVAIIGVAFMCYRRNVMRRGLVALGLANPGPPPSPMDIDGAPSPLNAEIHPFTQLGPNNSNLYLVDTDTASMHGVRTASGMPQRTTSRGRRPATSRFFSNMHLPGSPTRQAIEERDAGTLEPERVPPRYNPEWAAGGGNLHVAVPQQSHSATTLLTAPMSSGSTLDGAKSPDVDTDSDLHFHQVMQQHLHSQSSLPGTSSGAGTRTEGLYEEALHQAKFGGDRSHLRRLLEAHQASGDNSLRESSLVTTASPTTAQSHASTSARASGINPDAGGRPARGSWSEEKISWAFRLLRQQNQQAQQGQGEQAGGAVQHYSPISPSTEPLTLLPQDAEKAQVTRAQQQE